MYLKNEGDEACSELYSLWHDILKVRKQYPLRMLHHKQYDSFYSFPLARSSMKHMENLTNTEYLIRILNPRDKKELAKVVKGINTIGPTTIFHSYGMSPTTKNKLLIDYLTSGTTILAYAEAKGKIIGYLYGVFFKGIKVDNCKWYSFHKIPSYNIFNLQEFGRHPGYNGHQNVGNELIASLYSYLFEKFGENQIDYISWQCNREHQFYDRMIELNEEQPEGDIKYGKIALNQLEYDCHIVIVKENTPDQPGKMVFVNLTNKEISRSIKPDDLLKIKLGFRLIREVQYTWDYVHLDETNKLKDGDGNLLPEEDIDIENRRTFDYQHLKLQ